jgi:DNA-binding Lrp family transcriptional regulator
MEVVPLDELLSKITAALPGYEKQLADLEEAVRTLRIWKENSRVFRDFERRISKFPEVKSKELKTGPSSCFVLMSLDVKESELNAKSADICAALGCEMKTDHYGGPYCIGKFHGMRIRLVSTRYRYRDPLQLG